MMQRMACFFGDQILGKWELGSPRGNLATSVGAPGQSACKAYRDASNVLRHAKVGTSFLLGLIATALGACSGLPGEAQAFGSGDPGFDVLFQQFFGSHKGLIDLAPEGLIETRDHGFAVVGHALAGYATPATPGVRGTSPWLVRFDEQGHVLWQRTVTYRQGPFQGAHNAFPAIAENHEGDLVIAGQTDSEELAGGKLRNPDPTSWRNRRTAPGKAAVVLKYDRDGRLLWRKTYGPVGYSWSNAFSRAVTVPGGYLLIGYQQHWLPPPPPGKLRQTMPEEYPHLWIAKIDEAGALLWEHQYNNPIVNSVAPAVVDAKAGVLIPVRISTIDDAAPRPGALGPAFHTTYRVLKLDAQGRLLASYALAPRSMTFLWFASGPGRFLAVETVATGDQGHRGVDAPMMQLSAFDEDFRRLWHREVTLKDFGTNSPTQPQAILWDGQDWQMLRYVFDGVYPAETLLTHINSAGVIGQSVVLHRGLYSADRLPGLPYRLFTSADGQAEYVMVVQGKVFGEWYLVKIRLHSR